MEKECEVANSMVKPPSSAKMSFDINVIWLLNRYLLNDRNMENKKRAQRDHVTDSVVKLPSSVNDPLEIEVISLLYRYLLVTLE